MIVWQYGILACNTSTLKKMCFGELSWIWECCYSLDQSHKHHYINLMQRAHMWVVKGSSPISWSGMWSFICHVVSEHFKPLHLWLFLFVCMLRCLLNWGLRAGSLILEMALLISRLETHSVICDLS